ncbi:MAG TPA: transcriptional regulator [Bacteroidetes bacterium]|nr:transcriptional regulator [Bacteroidota bacterium]
MKRDAVNPLKAVGDANRVRILKMLEERELCVCEVREILDLSNSTVSQHLALLRSADLIVDTKDGKWVNYRLHVESGNVLVRSLLDLMKKSFEDDETVREDKKKARRVDRVKICGV